MSSVSQTPGTSEAALILFPLSAVGNFAACPVTANEILPSSYCATTRCREWSFLIATESADSQRPNNYAEFTPSVLRHRFNMPLCVCCDIGTKQRYLSELLGLTFGLPWFWTVFISQTGCRGRPRSGCGETGGNVHPTDS